MNTLSYKYSLFNMINEYNKNKPLIDAYLKEHPIEHYADQPNSFPDFPDPSNPFPDQPGNQPGQKEAEDDGKKILGLSIAVFVVILVINLILFIIALVLLMKDWKNLPSWAQVVSLICLLIGMPVITIIIVLVAKK